MLAGCFEDVEERAEVVLVVFKGLVHRLSDGLEGGEVNDCVNMVLAEEGIYSGFVAEVHLDERQLLAEDGADAFVVGLVAIGHVVRNDDVIPGLRQLDRDVASDKSGSAGDKYSFTHNLQK